MNAEPTTDRPAALILSVGRAEATDEPAVFGLSAGERLRRSLVRTGVTGIDRIRPGEAPPERAGARFIVLRDDYFYDERLVAGLVGMRNCVLAAPLDPEGAGGATGDGPAVAASADGQSVERAIARVGGDGADGDDELRRVGVLDVAPAYDPALRRTAPPFVHAARAETTRETERRIFRASYKGLTDLVTKWVFPEPALAAVRVLSRLGVRPNTVTAASWVLAVAVAWLFAEGAFALGLALGWVMTFLDTVDGKLARCTLTSSRFGDVFDHALDLVHPPLWWLAFAFGLPDGLAAHALAAWVVVGGYALGRALEGVFLASFGIELFVWRRFDGLFRTVVARRNPNLILLSIGVAVGSPAGGYSAVAVWTVACVGIAAARIALAFLARGRGLEIRPEMEHATA